MLKKEEIASPTSCLNKATDDEPIFVIRAKDPLAAKVVRLWADLSHGVHEEEKRREAYYLADQMDEWRQRLDLKIGRELAGAFAGHVESMGAGGCSITVMRGGKPWRIEAKQVEQDCFTQSVNGSTAENAHPNG